MPTYTAPSTQSTGALITASIWNTQVVENIKFFKDAPTFDGAVTITGVATFNSTTDSSSSTTGAAKFAGGVGVAKKLYVGTTINDQTISSAANFTGTMAVSGDITNTLSQNSALLMRLVNTNTGASASSSINMDNDVRVNNLTLRSYSNAAGSTIPDISDSALLRANGAGGLTLSAQHASGIIRFSTGGTAATMSLSSAGLLTVSGNSATYGIEGNGTNGLGIAATHASGAIRFYAGGTTERARIETNGHVLLNTTTNYARFVVAGATNTADLVALQDTGTSFSSSNLYMIFYNSTGGIAGKIEHTAVTTTNYATTSDQRLKSDLGISDSVDVLRSTRIHNYKWIEDGADDLGVFAQEAYLVKPRAISRGSDELTANGTLRNPWGVDYSKYVPDLIVGWQQHDARLAALEAKLLKETA